MNNCSSVNRGRRAAHRILRGVALLLLGLTGPAAKSAVARQAGVGDAHVHWTQVPEAQVKIDDKTPLAWNVLQPDKKDKKEKKESNLVLILLGHRYLMLDTRARVVYSVPLSQLHAQGADFNTGDLAQESQLVPSSDWVLRDVGPAELITLTLGDYGRTLEVDLPHPPDLRYFFSR
jgi:hypothetical protein